MIPPRNWQKEFPELNLGTPCALWPQQMLQGAKETMKMKIFERDYAHMGNEAPTIQPLEAVVSHEGF